MDNELNTLYDFYNAEKAAEKAGKEPTQEEVGENNTNQKYFWGKRSKSLLDQVHPDLQKIYNLLIQRTKQDLTIAPSTIRTIDEQIKFVKKGVSKTYKSRHLNSPSYAVDCMPLKNGKVDWKDLGPFNEMNDLIQECADELGIKIRLGRTFHDYPHVELHKSVYPDTPELLKELKERGLIS